MEDLPLWRDNTTLFRSKWLGAMAQGGGGGPDFMQGGGDKILEGDSGTMGTARKVSSARFISS